MGLLAACDPIGDGSLESCIGPYTGTFEVDSRSRGPLEGRILAYFGQPNAETPPQLDLTLTFDSEAADDIMDTPAYAGVAETGDVTTREGNIQIMGTFDFDDCKASGTWGAGDIYTNGTWRLSTGHSAY